MAPFSSVGASSKPGALQIQDAVNRTNDAVNAQLRQLDEALSRQLNAALQELGAALATIARHLTETYNRNSQRN